MNVKKLYNKYKDVIPYLFFGICTTVINVIVYWLMAHLLSMSTTISTFVAWFVAVVFAYITNRKWVFHSRVKGLKHTLGEIGSFFVCRIGTGIVDWIIMLLFVDLIGFNDVIIKFLANVIVIILNYITSRYLIFNNKISSYIVRNKYKLVLNSLICILFLLVSFLFLFNSPLHPLVRAESSVDSSVFKSIAIMMDNGIFPYIDTFDHKGPLLFILNFLGYKLGGYCGIWYIEFLSLFVTLFIVYKIARLKCSKFSSLIILFMFLSFLSIYFEGGNFIEEYTIPFICVSLYIFLDYLLNNKVTIIRLILCGFSFGSVIMLRPNSIALWIIFCLVILIKCFFEKKFKDLFKFILFFIVGLCIIVIPLIIWLYLNNSLSAFWDCYIKFNFSYSNSLRSNSLFYYRILTLLKFINNIYIFISIVFSIYIYFYKKDNIILYNFLFLVLSLIFISISGVNMPHYGMLLVSCIIYPISSFLGLKNKSKYVKYIVNSFLCILICLTAFDFIFYFPRLSYDDFDNISDDVIYISNLIKNNTSNDEKISVYGNWNIIYILSERLPTSRYSYQEPIKRVNQNILDEYFSDLKEYLPKYIVVQKESYDSYLSDFIFENNYSLIWKSNDSLYESASIFSLDK